MANSKNTRGTFARLHQVKDLLGLGQDAASSPRAPADELKYEADMDGSSGASRAVPCIVCGYDLSQQVVDWCPECGLPLARAYRDPTEWSAGPPRIGRWLPTALRIWSWDRRTRLRTAFVPVSAMTWKFAWIALVAAAVLMTVITWWLHARVLAVPGAFLLSLQTLMTFVVILGMLGAVTWLQQKLLAGKWRGRAFEPAAVHYATAWYPVCGMLLLLGMLGSKAFGADTGAWLIEAGWIALLVGMGCWAIWLADSLGMSGRAPYVELRVASFLLAVTFVVLPIVGLLPGLVGRGVAQTASTVRASIQKAMVSKPRVTTRTWGLLVNAGSEPVPSKVRRALAALGLTTDATIILEGKVATQQEVTEALARVQDNLREGDRLVCWIRSSRSATSGGDLPLEKGTLRRHEFASSWRCCRLQTRCSPLISGTPRRSLPSFEAVSMPSWSPHRTRCRISRSTFRLSGRRFSLRRPTPTGTAK